MFAKARAFLDWQSPAGRGYFCMQHLAEIIFDALFHVLLHCWSVVDLCLMVAWHHSLPLKLQL